MDCLRSLLLCGILCAASLAQSQTTTELPVGIGLHCWVGADGAPFFYRKIRCIADRELVAETLPDMQSQNVIDVLHRELHFGSGTSVERLFKANIERIRESGEVWNIRIYSDPYDASWELNRPQQLVRAVLCPTGASCNVMFSR